MILLFEAHPPTLRWCRVNQRDFITGSCEFSAGWFNKVIDDIGDIKSIQAIGYFILHGGDEIREPAFYLSAASLTKLKKCIKFLPEHNDIIYKTALFWINRLPMISHVLFSDTAFFSDLSPEASAHAIPYQLRKNGVQRYGGYGICHQWAWQRARASRPDRADKVISIHLGDHPNIAAIHGGKAVETTMGFVSVEGLPSVTSCGELDPGIIFHLFSRGMSFEEINRLLSCESGFSGLRGSECRFRDLLKRNGDKIIDEIRRIFQYSLQRYIGSFAAVLGGVQTLVFDAQDCDATIDFVKEVCRSVAFLGIETASKPIREGDAVMITAPESPVQVLCLNFNVWVVLEDKIRTLLVDHGV